MEQGRSSNVDSRITQNANLSHTNAGNASEQRQVRQSVANDAHIPTANVVRIMRRILPGHAKIDDDVKGILQLLISEYVGFVTSEANDICRNDKRRMITADDVLAAFDRLGFDNYVAVLTSYLKQYRNQTKGSSSQRGESSAGKSTADGGLAIDLVPAPSFGPAIELPLSPKGPSCGPQVELPPVHVAPNYGPFFPVGPNPSTEYFHSMGMGAFYQGGSSSAGAGPSQGSTSESHNDYAEFDISAYLESLGKKSRSQI